MRKKMRLPMALLCCLLLSVSACGQRQDQGDGEDVESESLPPLQVSDGEEVYAEVSSVDEGIRADFTVGVSYIPDEINPLSAEDAYLLRSYGIGETLYELDGRGSLSSRLVESLTRDEVDARCWHLKLREGLFFSDGTAFDAAALAACMRQTMAANREASGAAGGLVVEVAGRQELLIRTAEELGDLAPVLCRPDLILYRDREDGSYVFTGARTVEGLVPGAELFLEANPYYDGAWQERGSLALVFYENSIDLGRALKSGEVDLAQGLTLSAREAEELRSAGMEVAQIESGYVTALVLNTEEEALSDQRVRQAVSLLLNREGLADRVGGRAATGLFPNESSFAGGMMFPHDPDRARMLLKEAGYEDRDGDGILDRDGRALELTLTVREAGAELAEELAAQLRLGGIGAEVELVFGAETATGEDSWDMMLRSDQTGSCGDAEEALGAYLGEDIENGCSPKRSEKAASMLENLHRETDPKARIALAKDLQRSLLEEASVLALVSQTSDLGVGGKLAGYRPVGGDYLLVKADMGLGTEP